jgi:hypothetical protein
MSLIHNAEGDIYFTFRTLRAEGDAETFLQPIVYEL